MDGEEIIMTREEMLKKLDAGEDPLVISIEKWERFIKWMKLNPDEEPDSDWYRTSTCALCELHYPTCTECVVYEIDCCENDGSAWLNFWNEPTVPNAHKMLGLLKSAKE